MGPRATVPVLPSWERRPPGGVASAVAFWPVEDVFPACKVSMNVWPSPKPSVVRGALLAKGVSSWLADALVADAGLLRGPSKVWRLLAFLPFAHSSPMSAWCLPWSALWAPLLDTGLVPAPTPFHAAWLFFSAPSTLVVPLLPRLVVRQLTTPQLATADPRLTPPVTPALTSERLTSLAATMATRRPVTIASTAIGIVTMTLIGVCVVSGTVRRCRTLDLDRRD
jgi:hypothetical protein